MISITTDVKAPFTANGKQAKQNKGNNRANKQMRRLPKYKANNNNFKKTDNVNLTTRYSLRVTVAAVGTEFIYIVKPQLFNFADQLTGFQDYFQFYNMKKLKVTALPTFTEAQINTSTLYQIPQIVMLPSINGDSPATLQ